MAGSCNVRKSGWGVALAAGALLVTSTVPAAAQEGSRMRVLVPAFAATDGKVTRAGEKMADQLRKQINQMPTHAPADDKEVKAGLKKYGLKESDMDCTKWMQLAAQTQAAQLVLCGTMDEASGTVNAKFVPVGGGDTFEVPQFTAQTPEQGAQQVVQSFQTFVKQLSLVKFCDEYIQSQNWQQALDLCNQAVELNPRSVAAHYARGSALMNMDRNEEAFEAFRKVLEIDPIQQEAMLAAGILASKLGRVDVSQQYFKEYLDLNPGNEQVRLTIAHRLAQEGDPAGALRLVEEAAAAGDATVALKEYAGHFAMNAGLEKEKAGPMNGNKEEAQGFFRRAIRFYEQAVQMKGDSADATVLRNLMLAHKNVGNKDQAMAIGQRATQSNAQDAQTWLIYSDVLREADRTSESLQAMERAASIDPSLPGLATRRVVTMMESGRIQEAVQAAKAAVAANQLEQSVAENISQQITQRGVQHLNAKRFDQALSHFNAARELGRSERSIGMANFFHGFMLVTQADALLRTASTAAPARQARPLLERAKVLLDAAGGYTDQAAKRAELLQNVAQYMEVADALLKSGR